MHTKTRASAVKIYLLFLLISLFAVSGCGLDIDFGGGTGDDDVEENEVITGFIEEVIPDIGNSSLVVRASVVKDETVFCCEDTASVRDDFRIEDNLDPRVELEFFDGNSSLGTIRIPVFPGATIDISDITIEDRVPRYNYINVSFEGQVQMDSKNCVNDTTPSGTMKVEISSEGKETEVTVNLTSGTDIERGDEEDLPCEEIVEGRRVRVDGKLRIGETVDAEVVEIL